VRGEAMPEWITPAEAFRMILRGKHPENPGLAEQITSELWFAYPEMQKKKLQQKGHSPAGFEAAKNARDLLVKTFRDGDIAGRGILQRRAPVIDIDLADARTGSLFIWNQALDCSLTVPGRKYVNVVLKEADIRPLCGARRRGRPQEYDWEAIKAKAFALMNYHGDFRTDDPEWNVQERLVEQLADFCGAPDSLIREKLPAWLEEWRKEKTKVSTVSENQ
jgi:hypothetical protein